MRELPILNQDNDFDSIHSQEVDKWAGKEKHVLVLNYTMACALACDFCCYGCHPQRAEKMPLELALSLVEQAAELGVFSSIGFTGGEPMLFFDELLEIGKLLQQYSLPFTIATAAHWATSLDEARRVTDLLVARGLCRFNLSSDPSHEQFVPAENVAYAAQAANERSIPTIVTGVFYSPDEKLEKRMPQLVGLEYVLLLDKFVNKVGRATKINITQDKLGLRLGLENYRCYRKEYHDIVVFYDGSTYPCCSTFNRATKGIMVGNANQDSLRTLWKRVDGSSMFRTMKREGFARLYAIVQKYDPDLHTQLPAAESKVGACHLCNSIFKNPAVATRIRIAFERYEQEKVDETISMMVELIGLEKTETILRDIVHSP